MITYERVLEYMELNETELETEKLLKKIIRPEPTPKTIRLAKDLASHAAPLGFDRNDVVRSLLRCRITDEEIDRVLPFKKLLYKIIVVDVKYVNGRYITITKKVRRT